MGHFNSTGIFLPVHVRLDIAPGVGATTEGTLRVVMRLRFKLSHWGASNHAL